MTLLLEETSEKDIGFMFNKFQPIIYFYILPKWEGISVSTQNLDCKGLLVPIHEQCIDAVSVQVTSHGELPVTGGILLQS